MIECRLQIAIGTSNLETTVIARVRGAIARERGHVIFEGNLQRAARPPTPSLAAQRHVRTPRSRQEHNETHRRGEAGTGLISS